MAKQAAGGWLGRLMYEIRRDRKRAFMAAGLAVVAAFAGGLMLNMWLASTRLHIEVTGSKISVNGDTVVHMSEGELPREDRQQGASFALFEKLDKLRKRYLARAGKKPLTLRASLEMPRKLPNDTLQKILTAVDLAGIETVTIPPATDDCGPNFEAMSSFVSIKTGHPVLRLTISTAAFTVHKFASYLDSVRIDRPSNREATRIFPRDAEGFEAACNRISELRQAEEVRSLVVSFEPETTWAEVSGWLCKLRRNPKTGGLVDVKGSAARLILKSR